MAIYRVEHIYHRNSGLPRDDVVNTCHFADGDGADEGVAADIAAHVAAAFNQAASVGGTYFESLLSGVINRATPPTIKVYDEDSPGSPMYVATALGMRAAGNADSFPSEVALCASYSGYAAVDLAEVGPDDGDADSRPERPRSRYRNRMYLGPFNFGAGTSRPYGGCMEACIDVITQLRDVTAELAAADCSFVVYSKASNAADDVQKAWCDNEWDTQRRRGDRATARTTVTY